MTDFSELEIDLKELRPVQPSENLATRIERELAEMEYCRASVSDAGSKGLFERWRWRFTETPYKVSIGLGVAAAAAFLILARIDGDRLMKGAPAIASAPSASSRTTVEKADQLVVSGLSQVVYNTRDEGLFFADDAAQPVRRVRSQTRETLQWRNPSTGASLRVSYPSEEVELIPVSGQ
jgi:hypothetical protein